jgi:hypothetical protein
VQQFNLLHNDVHYLDPATGGGLVPANVGRVSSGTANVLYLKIAQAHAGVVLKELVRG